MKGHTQIDPDAVSDSESKRDKQWRTGRRRFLGSVAASVGLAAIPGSLAQSQAGDRELDGIIDEMSLDDKISRLHQNSESNIPALPDHGISKLDMRDAPHRVRTMRENPDVTVFPAGISAASTFDPELIREQGAAIGRECKADDGNAMLAPAVNINRVPVGGRAWEYYGEDPLVTARMAVEYTKGLQSEEVIATVKHYVANNQEAQRDSINVDVSERALHEIYYPGFKAAVQDGGAAGIMTSLNKINGEYASENEDVLLDALKGDWGFEGFTVCDFGGIHSTVDAALSGSDIELVSGEHFGAPLKQAVQDGIISEAKIDEMVRRVFWSLQTTGAMNMDTEDRLADGASATEEHFSVAEQIAEEGSVLLKNENDVLPLDENDIDEIAIVGPQPNSFIIKESNPSRKIGLVDGIENQIDGVSINTVPTNPFRPIESDVASPAGSDQAGFQVEYFESEDFSGDPASTAVVKQIQVDDVAAASGVSDVQSIRWTTQLTAPTDGTYRFSVETPGAATLSIDGEAVLENEATGFGAPAPASCTSAGNVRHCSDARVVLSKTPR